MVLSSLMRKVAGRRLAGMGRGRMSPAVLVEGLESRVLLSASIGSFTDGAATVTAGGYVSLYAKNVTDTGATVAGVRFYRESNGTGGLQAGGDTYVGMGVKSGTMWTCDTSTTGLANGTYTYYAVALDTANTASAASSVTATVSGSGFSNWSSFSAALAKVPLSVGPIASTSVVNFGTTVYTGALDTTITLDRIRGDNGPNRSGDGGAFTNNGSPPLPTNRGNVFEFTINPQTGSVPSFSSSQVAFPGPMRFMIDTTGDVYFTGDHYATDMNLYIAGTPALGSVGLSSGTVSAGTPVTVTASNVSETISPAPNLNATTGSNVLATVTNVQFYLDTNGTSGLQTGTDLLLGSGAQSGSTWTLSNASTTGLAAGTYTVFAVAVDPAGNNSTTTTTLTISGSGTGTPSIGSLSDSPTSVTSGSATTLTAGSVTETGGSGSITGVNFYRESNGTSGLQIGSDTLVGAGTVSGTNWTISASTSGLSAGTYTYYAVANDSNGHSSAVASTTLTVTSATGTPVIGSFAANPASVTVGASTTLTASNVTDTGSTITGVNFYRESNGTSGLQIGADTLIGAGTQSGTTWTISASTTGLAAGSYTYYAVATDASGASSAASSTVLTVTSAVGSPTIGGFAVSPTSVTVGSSATLTASNVTESGGTISAVKFYREANGTSGLQVGSDTLIGTGTQSGTTWTISTSTTGLAAGTYTYYAVATDSTGVSSAASSTVLTVTNAGTSGVQLAWNMTGQTNFGTQGLAAGTVGTGVSNSLGLTRGSGVVTTGSAASNAWGGANWATTSAAGISGNEFVTFGLTVNASTTLSLSALDMNYRRSSTGAASGYWQYQTNGGAWTLIGDYANEFSSTSSSGAAITEINLTSVGGLQNLAAGTVVNFRVTPYASTGSGGTWYVYDMTGNDLVVSGSTTVGAKMMQAAVAGAPSAAVVSQPAAAAVVVASGSTASGSLSGSVAATSSSGWYSVAVEATGTVQAEQAIGTSLISAGTLV